MPYNTFPFTWFKSSYRFVPEQTFTATLKLNTYKRLELPGTGYSNVFKIDDQIFLTASTTYTTANIPYYIRQIDIVSGNTQLTVRANPSYVDTIPVTNIDFGPTNSTVNFRIPGYVSFNIPLSGVTGQVPSLQITPAQAEPLSGDVRYIFYTFSRLIQSLWDSKLPTEKPVNVQLTKTEYLAEVGTIGQTYQGDYLLNYSTTSELKPEAV
jgi:hypothetical protein